MCALKVALSTAKGKRMASSDPVSHLGPLKRKFVRIMRWTALFSVAIATIAVVLVAQGDTEIRVHMLIATALGVGLSVLLGIALMTLVFLSNRVGHDSDAADHQQKGNDEF
jgi:hypothetical protein